MRTIETKVFTYSELSDDAKEKAREWYRTASSWNDFYTDCVFDDAATIADLMGIDLNQTQFTRMDGTWGYKSSIMFSGFWCQGDGASFNCEYRYKKCSVKAVASHTGNDKTLVRIAKELQTIQKRHFYKLRARSKVSGHYVHSGCMSVAVWHVDDEYRDIGDAESDIRECLRDFANWIYRQLENEWEYQNSNAAIEENILINEYEFTEQGERA